MFGYERNVQNVWNSNLQLIHPIEIIKSMSSAQAGPVTVF
jgi:hypothetical protein